MIALGNVVTPCLLGERDNSTNFQLLTIEPTQVHCCIVKSGGCVFKDVPVFKLEIVGHGNVTELISCYLVVKSPCIEGGAIINRASYVFQDVAGRYVEPFAQDVHDEAREDVKSHLLGCRRTL
ncbi:hypothetical protein C4K37_2688 [Pseudomonas chlororaphis subsp. piscium]|uniref:Uncharacterized protein n=1 Tax=Pseudomonas chlororaphis TaxID=587753 RepID=A0AAX3G4M1_9PSED|nr:hypothetical protein C4K37_2688 [Pseudomonas chlororaphis subsp. piscium]AZC43621.1 hypothetical protein C4K36_2696 [Pseudomonas chlororaphis subsp. piscium]VEF77964.1 Uncharacterised protein [Pseudomonas chlororaphis]